MVVKRYQPIVKHTVEVNRRVPHGELQVGKETVKGDFILKEVMSEQGRVYYRYDAYIEGRHTHVETDAQGLLRTKIDPDNGQPMKVWQQQESRPAQSGKKERNGNGNKNRYKNQRGRQN